MDRADIPFLSATGLSRLIKTREVSPVEAVQAYLERIDRVDGKLNSYITICGDEALEVARDAENAIARGEYIGPMHGIPVAVKDQFNTKGILTTCGSSILSDFVPGEDATVITNLKKAGAILLGKLNMSEFAMGDAFHHPYGTPHNPWALDRNPGVSSSGSGAATAAFLCSTSVGEDTGGSIRGPASYCGLVGLRPGQGRVSRYGMHGSIWSMDTGGPISRTVEDCAMTMGAIAGYDPKDPYTWNAAVPDYMQALDGNVTGVRVGVIREWVDNDVVEPDVRDAVAKAVALLGDLGATVEEVSIPLAVHGAAIFTPISHIEGASVHYRWIRERLQDYDHNIQIRQLAGSILPAQAYYKALKLRAILRQQVLEMLERVDVLALPTFPHPATRIPASAGINSKEELMAGYYGRRSFTSTSNLSGVPAISVPCGFTSSEPPELPIGLQLLGRSLEEGTLMKVAYAYEQGTPWHDRRPTI